MKSEEIVNVIEIEPKLKHPTIFKHFDGLAKGESFIIHNDHDPIPLFYELRNERGDIFNWEYLEQGPEYWKVRIGKNMENTLHTESQPSISTSNVNDESAEDIIDVTKIEPKLKHPSLFQKFDSLEEGGAFILLNDHDPKPFYYQLIAERGTIFTWEYQQQGPDHWKVLIKRMQDDGTPRIGEIVAKDIRKAEILKTRGIDFCCGGKKTLKQACEDANVDIKEVEKAFENIAQNSNTPQLHFDQWELDFLVDYVINIHHTYIKENEELIIELSQKVARQHSNKHPELIQVAQKIVLLLKGLLAHMVKEEKIVFPYVKELVAKKWGDKKDIDTSFHSIKTPIQVMEMEHDASGEELRNIRMLTDNYTLPQDACNSYAYLFDKMKEFESDLLQHVHLENNILFPKALLLEKELG